MAKETTFVVAVANGFRMTTLWTDLEIICDGCKVANMLLQQCIEELMTDLWMEFHYNTENPDDLKIYGNVKRECLAELIIEFLALQMGRSPDTREPNKLSMYIIRIDIDLSGDEFSAKSNTGNLALRDGILLDIIRVLK